MTPTRRRKVEITRIGRVAHPRAPADLCGVWKAFVEGQTWERVGKRSRKVGRFRHKRYQGRLQLAWAGKALRFVVEEADASGRIAGAFLGQVRRHGRTSVEQMDMQFR